MSAAAHVLIRCVDDDPVDPGSERRIAPERPDVPQHAPEGVLDDLLGVRRVARDANGQAVDAIPVAAHEGLRRPRVRSSQLRQESSVRIDGFSREMRRLLVQPGLLIGPFHYARSAIHLTLLRGRRSSGSAARSVGGPHSSPMSSSSSASFGGRKQRGYGAAQGLQPVEPDLLSRPRALHHPAQPSGVVLPDPNDEGRVLAKMLCRLHAPAPLVITHVYSLVTVVRGPPCANRGPQREKWRERAGARWRAVGAYGILSNASCREPWRSIEARGRPETHASGGISSTPRSRRCAPPPHQEGPGSPGPIWLSRSARPTRARSSRPFCGVTCRMPRPGATCATRSRKSGRPCPGPSGPASSSKAQAWLWTLRSSMWTWRGSSDWSPMAAPRRSSRSPASTAATCWPG